MESINTIVVFQVSLYFYLADFVLSKAYFVFALYN
jgi:hypothetical protein